MNENTNNKTVLVVDDQPTSMDILVQTLGKANFHILIAESGQEALQVLQEAARQQSLPNIILLDVSMPGIDGFETCRQIKATPGIDDIPVLFITAHDESVDLVRGFDVGGADYVTKPVNLPEVQARINTHLEMHRLQSQLAAQNDSLNHSLQQKVVQLEVETESRKQMSRDRERLLAERDQLLALVRNQSDQLNDMTSNALASQNHQQQSMLRLLGQQMQEKLSSLRSHLDAVYAQLHVAEGVKVAAHINNTSVANNNGDYSMHMDKPSAIEHLNASISIIEKAAQQASQILADLETTQADETERNNGLLNLSAREKEVLNLIAKGKDNSEIAANLHVEPTTVRTHRARIMSKLHVKNAYELMRVALLHVHCTDESKL